MDIFTTTWPSGTGYGNRLQWWVRVTLTLLYHNNGLYIQSPRCSGFHDSQIQTTSTCWYVELFPLMQGQNVHARWLSAARRIHDNWTHCRRGLCWNIPKCAWFSKIDSLYLRPWPYCLGTYWRSAVWGERHREHFREGKYPVNITVGNLHTENFPLIKQ